MKKLADILAASDAIEILGSIDKWIRGFEFDSRRVSKDILFVAKNGTVTDGHEYITNLSLIHI